MDVLSWEWAGKAGSSTPDGNPGRCDVIACVDHFGISDGDGTTGGATKALSPTETTKPDLPGRISSQLEQVFVANNLAPEWRNYRLKMTQVDFVDAQGNATHSGNSQIEAGFISTASCISCHSRAGANVSGLVKTSETKVLLLADPKSIGPMHAAWFNDPAHPATGPRTYYRVDFMWSLLHAQQAAAIPEQ